MKSARIALLTSAFIALLSLASNGLFAAEPPLPQPSATPITGQHTFVVKDGSFLLDGKPLQIICAEMHYPRIPQEYWRDRLRKAKAMGCNTVATYVFWNVHEPKQGQFDFRGNADLAKFIRTAQEEELWVFLRTGPYVCAEFEFGGYPGWILKNHAVRPRTTEPHFVQYVQDWFKRLGQEVAPLQITHGGPIILSQFGNEDGSINDPQLAAMHDLQLKGGIEVPLVTAEMAGAPSWKKGNQPLSNSYPAINGGNPDKIISIIQNVLPNGPYFITESYPGWYSNWGGGKPSPNIEGYAKFLDSVLGQGISVSLYMFHGGSNFNFVNGGGWYNNGYWPITTSYDYSVPLDEAGRITPSFLRNREVIAKHLPPGTKLPPIPSDNPIIAIPRVALTESVSLQESGLLGTPHLLDKPVAMEDLDQSLGFVLYRTVINHADQAKLTIEKVRDHVVALVDGRVAGSWNRRASDNHAFKLNITKVPATLDLLVENMGRDHYGDMGDAAGKRRGIFGKVTWAGEELIGWKAFNLPLNDIFKIQFAPGTNQSGPAFYRGTFDVSSVGDTFLDLRGWNKGVVWINGHNLNRYWHIGPQQTLYVPGPWLKSGKNEIVIFEQLKPREDFSVEGLKEPILDKREIAPVPPRSKDRPIFTAAEQVAAGTFAEHSEGEVIRFDSPRKASLVALQIDSSWHDVDFTSVGDIAILDTDGKVIKFDEGALKVAYVSSEEVVLEDDRAEYVFDGFPESIWQTPWGNNHPKPPHLLVIDLGEPIVAGGIRYSPRPGDFKGNAKDFRVYLR